MSSRVEGLNAFAVDLFRKAALIRDIGQLTRANLKLQALADREIDRVQDEASHEGIVPECHKGCDACCHRLVEASIPEVLSIADHAATRYSAEQRAKFIARVAATEAQNAPFWQDHTAHAPAPCPFLVDGSCSIYDLRPISCRALNSTSAKACHALYIEDRPVPFRTVPDQNALASLSKAAALGCGQAGMASGLYELGPTVALLLAKPVIAASLSGMVPELERLKLFSEWNSTTERVPPVVALAHENPLVKAVTQFARDGVPDLMPPYLARISGSPLPLVMGMTLPHQYDSQDELDMRWERLDSAIQGFEDYRGPAREAFELLWFFNTFNWAYTGKNVRPYLERFMGKVHALAKGSVPHLAHPIKAPRRPGKFRLGYISPRIKKFNGTRWAMGVLPFHGPEIETYVINLVSREDATSIAFRRQADIYLHLPFSTLEAAEAVRKLDLDALIFTDVGMCGPSIQLASLRLARRQFNSWGHPVTSGSPTMDYYLSSEHMEPADGEGHYSERLVRLPKSGLSTPRRPLMPSGKSHADLGVPEGGYLLFSHLPFKHVPRYDELFRQVISRSSKPLVIVGAPDPASQVPLRRRLGDVNTIFLPFLTMPDYLRLVHLADASLETPAFGGAFTALDTLTLGTPLVTLPGPFMRGRLSLGYLREGNLAGLIARDEEDYIDLALNTERRDQIMAGIDLEVMYDNTEAVAALDQLLLTSD